VIPRRFKEFYELYNYIKNRYKKIKFNQFPKKTFFSLNSQAKLEKRKDKLNSYIQFLFRKSEKRIIPEFLEFIEIQDYTL